MTLKMGWLKFSILALASIIISISNMSAQSPAAVPPSAPADAAVYGKFPADYKDVTLRWLETQLLDASSAKIEWLTAPTAADLPAMDGKVLHGYRVDFKVNSRNRFGSYTGMQKHGVLIRDGEVVKGIGFGY